MTDTSALRYPQQDRYSFVWLGLGLGATWFTSPSWVVPLASWLASILLLRFFRTQPLWRAILLFWPTSSLVVIFSQWGFIPAPVPFAVVSLIIAGLIGLFPYLLDRWTVAHLPAALHTLVFPFAWVTLDYMFSFAITGTISSPAYTQFSVGPLMQIAAVAGIWPITFLINWAATAVNAAWERGTFRPGWRSPLGAWAGVMVLILVGGGLRLALAQPGQASVPVAGIAIDTLTIGEVAYQAQTGQAIDVPDDADFTSPELMRVQAAFGAFFQRPEDSIFALARAEVARINDELLRLSRREAQAGARIIAWSEANAFLLKSEEAAYFARAQELARDEGIYLLMAIVTLTPGQERYENKVVTIDPQGQIAATYHKNKLPLGESSLGGDGSIPVIDTPYGRIAAVICYDMDSPDFIRQLGQQGVDIVFAGSGDWAAISPWHAHIAVVRGIENGFTVVRPVRGGLLVNADQYGRITADLDYFTNQERVLSGVVPAQQVPTLYPVIGDGFAVMALLGTLAATLAALVGGVRQRLVRRRARATLSV